MHACVHAAGSASHVSSNRSLEIEPGMPALPPLPPLLLTLVLCAMVAMAVIGTAHADSPAKLQYWEQMKAMMQAADGDSLGDSHCSQ